MMLRQFLLNHRTTFVVGSLLLGGVVFFLPHTHANPDLSTTIAPIQSTGLLLDSSFDGSNATVDLVKLSADAPHIVSDFGNNKFQNTGKELFLSPNRTFVAVTLAPFGEEDPSTYIAKIDGTQITDAYPGRFESWAPDSSKALLYVSTTEAPWDRKIYALNTQDHYSDMGLPNGTISADISPVDGSIIYSFTSGGTDASTIYDRDPQGNDKVLVESDNTVLAWVRWSPKGDKISFMKAGQFAENGDVWTMDADGTGAGKVSDIVWNYPAIWSPDGTKLAFSNAGNIWDYDPVAKSLHSATNVNEGVAAHPSYSADGKTIVFSTSASGNNQIWSVQNGTVSQLTNDNQEKDYPILP